MPSPLRTTQLKTATLPAGATSLAQSKHLATVLEQSRRAVERLQRENDDLSTRNRKLACEKDALSARLSTLERDAAQHEVAMELLRANAEADRREDLKRLQVKDSELDAARIEASGLRAECEKNRQELDGLRGELESSRASLKAVCAQRASTFEAQLSRVAKLTREASSSFKAAAVEVEEDGIDAKATGGNVLLKGLGSATRRALAVPIPPDDAADLAGPRRPKYTGRYLYSGSSVSSVASSLSTSVESQSQPSSCGVSRPQSSPRGPGDDQNAHSELLPPSSMQALPAFTKAAAALTGSRYAGNGSNESLMPSPPPPSPPPLASSSGQIHMSSSPQNMGEPDKALNHTKPLVPLYGRRAMK